MCYTHLGRSVGGLWIVIHKGALHGGKLGHDARLPLLGRLGPIGLARLLIPESELAKCRAYGMVLTRIPGRLHG